MSPFVESPDDTTLADLVSQPNPSRSPGLHVSQIYGDIIKCMDPKRFGGDIEPGYLAVGIAFEEMLATMLKALLHGWEKPGEFHLDGIILSPDGFGGDDFEGVDEIKVTWMKPPAEPEYSCGKVVYGGDGLEDTKFLRYHLQGKAYAKVLGVTRVRYRVLFVTGPFGWKPSFRVFTYTYTQQEIDENWAMLVQHAKDQGWL